MKVWHVLEIEIARIAETVATSRLWALNTTGIEFSEDKDYPDFVTLRAYFNTAQDVEQVRTQIVHGLKLTDLPESCLRSIKGLTIADQDWLAEWKRGYEPIEVGHHLLISPSWRRNQVKDSWRVVIEIDPGMAFGTGTHETTRGCLELLEKYWPLESGDGALLDVGTGTGILAIAAIKLASRARVTGIDIDPEAIAIAEENASINGVAEEIELEVNKLSSFQGQEFDVVVANLTADIIVTLAADFAKALRPQGVLIVSGILEEQGDGTLKALIAKGFKLIESKPDGDWITFTLRLQ